MSGVSETLRSPVAPHGKERGARYGLACHINLRGVS